MEDIEFVKNFALQFDETGPELITLNTKFKDLDEWGSLTALSIIAMTDEEYGVRLTAEDIKNATTLLDIYALVQSRI